MGVDAMLGATVDVGGTVGVTVGVGIGGIVRGPVRGLVGLQAGRAKTRAVRSKKCFTVILQGVVTSEQAQSALCEK